MAVELIHAEKGVRPMGETVVVDRHLYLTEDKSRVVEEGDPASRWLWASPGQEVSRAQAERLGAVAPPAAEPEREVSVEPETPVEPEPAPEPKQRQPAPNKQRTKPGDK